MTDTHAGKLLDLADEAGLEPRVLPQGGMGWVTRQRDVFLAPGLKS